MKKEEKEISKNKKDKREILTKKMAGFLLVIMVLATCSTFIYYLIANVK